ncbi:IclR family transcriptional regulator [Streptomyces rubiginosohelvolus]|uniref:IclR family transcriptional regulator n=1 Tax=Streptomyces rubiginosohelvolus TaxID=67362 RepID=UPI0036AF064C
MQLVRRTLLVVDHLARTGESLTFQDLCGVLDIPGASLHRLLSVMEDEQFVVRHRDSRRYFLGPAASEVGLAARRAIRASEYLGRGLADLAEASGGAALLTEFIDNRAVCTARYGGEELLGLSAKVGTTMPLHATAEARVLMIDMPRYAIARLLADTGLTLFRPRTPRRVDEVMKRMALIRRHGYGVSYDEFDNGIWSLAAPVRNGAEQVVATVAVATTEARLSRPGVIDEMRSQILELARGVSAELGHWGTRAA